MAFNIINTVVLLVIWIQAVLARINPADLQVQPNMRLLEDNKMLVHGTILQLPDPISRASDGQIVHLALRAFEAMEQSHQDYSRRFQKGGDLSKKSSIYPYGDKRKPNVITVLAVDQSAYIASSAIGGPSLFYNRAGRYFADVSTPSKLTTLRMYAADGFNKCRLATVNMPNGAGGHSHRNGANCGEWMSLLAYEQQNEARLPSEARMVTAYRDRDGNVAVDPPCDGGRGTSSSFGCTQALDWSGWYGKIFGIAVGTPEVDWTIDFSRANIARLSFA